MAKGTSAYNYWKGNVKTEMNQTNIEFIETYKKLKQILYNNECYETLLYLILRVQHGLENDGIEELTFSQVEYPYLINVKMTYDFPGIIPCYMNIEITEEIMNLIFKIHNKNHSSKIFKNDSLYHYKKITELSNRIFNNATVIEYRKNFALWSINILSDFFKGQNDGKYSRKN